VSQTPTISGSSERPPRPDEAPGARRPEHRWLPVIAVALTIVVVVFGGYVVAGALSEPAGAPVDLSGVVRVTPLSGWSVTAGPHGSPPGVRLTRGGGNLDVVFIANFGGTPDDLALAYVREVLRPQLARLSVSSRTDQIRLASGLSGVRFTYVGVTADTGASVEGEVTAVVTPAGHGVVFDGWAPAGLLPFVISDIETMVDRAMTA
jgi:hypothetical protein